MFFNLFRKIRKNNSPVYVQLKPWKISERDKRKLF
jgi:hypothetical protein